MTPLEVGILGCVVLVVLLLSSMPVGFAMAFTGLLGFSMIVSPSAALSMGVADVYDKFSDYNLTVIPLFVLMGQVAFHSGISRRLYDTAYCWLGSIPGGLAMATVGACTAFGAICGSGPATAATMAAVALPEMKRFGYDMELGTGTVAAGGTLGMMIPPSVVFICYGIMTEQSIGKLFVSGILPGIITALLFCAAIYLMCRWRPSLGPAAASISWAARFKSLAGVAETLVLFILVMGGMFGGFFTPTEAAAIGAAGSIVLAAVRRQISLKLLRQSLEETARTSCMVMVIVAGAIIFGRFLAVSQMTQSLASSLGGLPLPPWAIMSVIIAFYVLGGCFIDALALMLLTVPIFYPVVLQLGYDPIWFGVVMVLVTQIGTITPPVGVCAYVVSGIERSVPLHTVFRGSLPFVIALILVSALLVAFPKLVLLLPSLVQ